MHRFRPWLLPILPAFAALSGCGSADDASVGVAIIGEADPLTGEGTRLSTAGQLVRSATREGLVALGRNGEVEPAIAERWIVTIHCGPLQLFDQRYSAGSYSTIPARCDSFVQGTCRYRLCRVYGGNLLSLP